MHDPSCSPVRDQLLLMMVGAAFEGSIPVTGVEWGAFLHGTTACLLPLQTSLLHGSGMRRGLLDFCGTLGPSLVHKTAGGKEMV